MTNSLRSTLSDSPPAGVAGTPPDDGKLLNIVFMFDVGDTLMENGCSLRYFRYARLLRRQGHRVYFLVPGWSYHEGILQQLVERGDIDGFARLTEYYATGWVNAGSRFFVHPGARNWMLRNRQAEALQSFLTAVEAWQCDLVVLSN